MKSLKRLPFFAAALAVVAVAAVSFSGVASATSTTIGPVTCDLPVYNSTHFALKLGQTVTCTINATDKNGHSTVWATRRP